MYHDADDHGPGHVSISEARADFAQLVNRAAFGGERVRVVRHGRVVAAIVPIEDLERLDRLDRGPDSAMDDVGSKGDETRPAVDDPGTRAVRLLREHGGAITMTTDQILALTRGD